MILTQTPLDKSELLAVESQMTHQWLTLFPWFTRKHKTFRITSSWFSTSRKISLIIQFQTIPTLRVNNTCTKTINNSMCSRCVGHLMSLMNRAEEVFKSKESSIKYTLTILKSSVILKFMIFWSLILQIVLMCRQLEWSMFSYHKKLFTSMIGSTSVAHRPFHSTINVGPSRVVNCFYTWTNLTLCTLIC